MHKAHNAILMGKGYWVLPEVNAVAGPGSAVFVQVAVGSEGFHFRFYKCLFLFRSMRLKRLFWLIN
jgi:hypothetical protein